MGIFSVLTGLAGAFQLDTPAGPTIVVCAAALFAASLLKPRIGN
ncbi:MAG: metal ABC transporter permease [Pseudohongiellaceae bacterium]